MDIKATVKIGEYSLNVKHEVMGYVKYYIQKG